MADWEEHHQQQHNNISSLGLSVSVCKTFRAHRVVFRNEVLKFGPVNIRPGPRVPPAGCFDTASG